MVYALTFLIAEGGTLSWRRVRTTIEAKDIPPGPFQTAADMCNWAKRVSPQPEMDCPLGFTIRHCQIELHHEG